MFEFQEFKNPCFKQKSFFIKAFKQASFSGHVFTPVRYGYFLVCAKGVCSEAIIKNLTSFDLVLHLLT